MDVLIRFRDGDAGRVLAWVQSPEELDAWASRTDFPLDPAVFSEWHADPDVLPYALERAGRLCAYGEIWDAAEGEAEVARIIVAPQSRGAGVGRAFVRLLAEEARRRGFQEVWLRVLPMNAAAIASYRHAGFRRADPAEEQRFNRGQPREYAWMRFAP